MSNPVAALVAQLRALIDEPDESVYTDAVLLSRIVSYNSDLNVTAYHIWLEKSAALSTLVDITEGGSSRKNSQASTNAMAMAKHFQAYLPNDPSNPTTVRRSQTRAIERA